MVKLGDKVKDRITGFKGIVTGKADYLFGCTQCLIAPMMKGKSVNDGAWIDEQRLSVEGQSQFKPPAPATLGGPQMAPPVSGRR